jgi:hypothetical protein
MDLKTAIHILEDYNKWRRGEDIQIASPKDITIALDLVINLFKDK